MSKSRRAKSIALLLALAFVFTSLFSGIGAVAFAADDEGTRLYGDNRYETAVEISKAGWTASDDVVLVSGEAFPDALAAGPLAQKLDAPILLTDTDTLPSVTKTEIDRLGAEKVYIVGGTGVVTEAVATATGKAVERIGGKDRYETAVMVAEKLKELGFSTDEVIIARSDDYPDALAASAVNPAMPILFAGKAGATSLVADTEDALTDLAVKEAFIVGETGAVSAAIKEQIDGIVADVTRIGDADRVKTAVAIANYFKPTAGYKGVVLATGYNYPDALAGAPYAAKKGYALMLTDRTGNLTGTTVTDFIKANTGIKADAIVALGGPTIVSAAALTAAVEAATPVALAIVKVAAVKANTLKVTFNKAVTDTSKAKFEVKKGSTVIVMDVPTWNEDKTEATLVKSSSNFSAGDYTVTVSGLEGLDAERSSATITITDQTVKSIEFVGKELVKAADGQSASFRYVVKDQYGSDITKSVSLNASSSLGVEPSLNASTGIGTITYDFATDVFTKTVVVVLVHPETGVSATATLDVVAAANITTFTFGDVTLPSGATRIVTGKTTAATVPVTAVDQYGNTIKDVDTLNTAINLIPSDARVAFTFASVDGNPVINIDTSGLDQASKIVLTAIVKANGGAYTKIFDIVKPAEPYVVTLGDITAEIIAAGDNVVLPITVKDQFGEDLTAAQIAENAAKINAMVSGGGVGAVISNPTVVTDRNSANYGKMVFTAQNKGTAIIVATSKNGTVSTKTVTVKDARVTTDVIAPANVALMQGASKNLEFALYDQYGVKIGTPEDNSALTYKVTLSKISGDEGAVTTSLELTGTDESLLTSVPVTAAADKTGSYKVTAELLKDAKTVSSAAVTVTVVKNNQTGLTYSIDAIPTLAGDKDYTAADPYAREVTVRAKDAAGMEYVINPADIISISSSNTSIAGVDLDTRKVFGKDITGGGNTAEKKATITVTLNTLDGIKTAKTEVTVSPATPKVQELRAVAAPIGGDGWVQDSLPDSATNKLTYVDTQTNFATGINFYLVGKDQYGVWENIPAARIIVNSTNNAAVNAFTVADSKLQLTNAEGLQKNKDILATVMQDNGSVQITIKVTD